MNSQNRVIQLDSQLLDDELGSLLNKQLDDSISILKLSQWKDEFQLGLSLLLFRLTTWRGSTYGLKLHNLALMGSKNGLGLKKKIFLLGLILGKYGYSKFNSYLYRENGKEKVKEAIEKLTKLYQLLDFYNFVSFLVGGRFPNLAYRISQIELKKTKLVQEQSETISFEFQNRQLIWNTLTEFLMFIMPKLNLSYFLKSDAKIDPNLRFLPERVCLICYSKDSNEKKDDSLDNHLVTNPHETNCGHVYCYTCICNQLELGKREGKLWACARCGEEVEYAKPV
ncbi:unnamed protein product [Kuraishia capsulata CBS 1993]|uniref:RING-type domain-containing protein n=1 Tax=Kuraishia capsulata CBS 1993 TaxID=1382522 RepID=W6MVI2_9ASCO|nr:uncharacterized protein KUCA_T00005972001 [Kuraishia capsulata CBS 1993]CDK29977.1 unnamed protein product [Kuraishia capsulata CBS 1993]